MQGRKASTEELNTLPTLQLFKIADALDNRNAEENDPQKLLSPLLCVLEQRKISLFLK